MIIRPLALVLFSKDSFTGAFASPGNSITTPVSEPSSSEMFAEPPTTVQITSAHLTLATSVVAPVSSKVISVFSGNEGLPSMIDASQLSASECTSAYWPRTTFRTQWRSLPSTSVQEAVTWNSAFLSLVTALPFGPVTILSISTVVVGITRLWI